MGILPLVVLVFCIKLLLIKLTQEATTCQTLPGAYNSRHIQIKWVTRSSQPVVARLAGKDIRMPLEYDVSQVEGSDSNKQVRWLHTCVGFVSFHRDLWELHNKTGRPWLQMVLFGKKRHPMNCSVLDPRIKMWTVEWLQNSWLALSPRRGYKRSWPIHSKAFVDLERDYHCVPRGVLWPSAGLWYIDVGTSHPGLILLDKNKNC